MSALWAKSGAAEIGADSVPTGTDVFGFNAGRPGGMGAASTWATHARYAPVCLTSRDSAENRKCFSLRRCGVDSGRCR